MGGPGELRETVRLEAVREEGRMRRQAGSAQSPWHKEKALF